MSGRAVSRLAPFSKQDSENGCLIKTYCTYYSRYNKTKLLLRNLRPDRFSFSRADLLDVTVIVHEHDGKDSPAYFQELLDRGVLHVGLKQNQRGAAKYVLDLPGNSAAWRLGSRFGDGAVTLKSKTVWNE